MNSRKFGGGSFFTFIGRSSLSVGPCRGKVKSSRHLWQWRDILLFSGGICGWSVESGEALNKRSLTGRKSF